MTNIYSKVRPGMHRRLGGIDRSRAQCLLPMILIQLRDFGIYDFFEFFEKLKLILYSHDFFIKNKDST